MQGLIELWCESNLNGDFTITRKDIPERIQFYVDSIEKKAQIDFIKCSEGRYTISFKVGPNPFVSEKIAEYLLSQIEASNIIKRIILSNNIKCNYESNFSYLFAENENDVKKIKKIEKILNRNDIKFKVKEDFQGSHYSL